MSEAVRSNNQKPPGGGQSAPAGLSMHRVGARDRVLKDFVAASMSEETYGNQKKRLAAVPQGTGGVFHRNSAHRSGVRCPGAGANSMRERHLRAGCAYRMAYASARPDADRHGRPWARAALGCTRRRNPAGRCRVVSGRREALAWRGAFDFNDPYRHAGGAQWQPGRLDGKSQRRTIPGRLGSIRNPPSNWVRRRARLYQAAGLIFGRVAAHNDRRRDFVEFIVRHANPPGMLADRVIVASRVDAEGANAAVRLMHNIVAIPYYAYRTLCIV